MASLSVIVTFYDEVAFLRTALSSICAQRLDEAEILVVNDNPERFSAEDVAALCRGLSMPFQVLQHPHNKGLSDARNTGMAEASGDFIAFLDADDYYVQGGLAEHFAYAAETRADITHAATYFTHSGSPDVHYLPRDKAMFSEKKVGDGLLGIEEAQFITSSWSSIYRREFLEQNNLRFDPEQRKFEDRLFVLHTVAAAKTIAFLGKPTRVWRGRAGSISVTKTTPETHLLQVQLLEKSLRHIRGEVAAKRLPPRFEKRELFNTVSRLIWDMDIIDAILADEDPSYRDMAKRIPELLGDDSFSHAIFNDSVLARVNRVGMKTRKGRITRSAFYEIHKHLRDGDFQAAKDTIQSCSLPALAPTPKRARKKGRKLILHLGLHKTGSTFVQHHLKSYRADLLKHGVLVPNTGFEASDFLLRDGATPGHQGLVRAIRMHDPKPWDRLSQEVADSGARTVLISCENMLFPLSGNRADLIRDLVAHFGDYDKVSLVAMVRSPHAYAEALFREWASISARGTSRGIGAFLVDHASSLTDLPSLFTPFEQAFDSKVKLGDFDANRGKALWPAFAGLAGLPDNLPTLDAPRYPSPDRETVIMLQLLSTLVQDLETRQKILHSWFSLNPAPKNDASLISPKQRLELVDKWEEQSREFAAERGYSPDLDAMRFALSSEVWSPPPAIDMDRLHDLIDSATFTAGSLFAPAPVSHAQMTANPVARREGTVLTIRLRPWAANLLRRAKQLSLR